MPAEQGPGPDLDIIKETFKVLPEVVIDKMIASMRSELGLPPKGIPTPGVTNQLPTSDVGTRIEEINSLKRNISEQVHLAEQNQNTPADPEIIIDMAEKAIGLGIVDEVSLSLKELGKRSSVVNELRTQAEEAGKNPELPYLADGFDSMQGLIKVAEAFSWDKDTDPKSLSSRLLENMKEYISANAQIVENWKSRHPPAAALAETSSQAAQPETKLEEREVLKPVIKAGGASEANVEADHPNQDAYFYQEYSNGITAAVCDGVGSTVNARAASQSASRAIREEIDTFKKGNMQITDTDFQETIFPKAEAAIEQYDKPDGYRGSTTAAVVDVTWKGDDQYQILVSSVGDSRVYLFEGTSGRLIQLSKDQGAVAGLTDEDDVPYPGREPFYYANRNVLNSYYLGHGSKPADRFTNNQTYEAKNGDLLLLLTDGITDPFTRPQLEGFIREGVRRGETPEQISRILIKAVRDDWKANERFRKHGFGKEVLYKLQVVKESVLRQAKEPNWRAHDDDATAVVIQLGSERVLETVAPSAEVEEEIQQSVGKPDATAEEIKENVRERQGATESAVAVERPSGIPYAEWIALNPRERIRLTSRAEPQIPEQTAPPPSGAAGIQPDLGTVETTGKPPQNKLSAGLLTTIGEAGAENLTYEDLTRRIEGELGEPDDT